ncbi:MAG: ABC transporter substrate-binding protein [Planctomycetes bacterium]|nr:ABC transporter substrate-binding protein [Planctomycetota bacterium]
MQKYWFIILLLLVAGQTVIGSSKVPKDPNELLLAKWDVVIKDPNDPNKLLLAKWDAVVKLIQAKDVDQKVKEDIIDKMVSPLFDFSLMGKLALGKTNWKKLTSSQRVKYAKLFTKRLKTSYREKIKLFKDEKVFFKPAVHKKKSLHIPMSLISSDKKIAILYKLRKVEKRWKIYDVEIQGVSIILTYRSQFNDTLKHNTVAEFINQLKKSPTP